MQNFNQEVDWKQLWVFYYCFQFFFLWFLSDLDLKSFDWRSHVSRNKKNSFGMLIGLEKSDEKFKNPYSFKKFSVPYFFFLLSLQKCSIINFFILVVKTKNLFIKKMYSKHFPKYEVAHRWTIDRFLNYSQKKKNNKKFCKNLLLN